MLFILDNHESNILLKAVTIAQENGIVLLTIPPHTSHCLQPLDRAIYGPFKSYYNTAIDCWICNNCKKILKIYDILALVNQAYLSAMTPSNIMSGFTSTGICLLIVDIFADVEIISSELTDRLIPVAEQLQTTAPETVQNTTPFLMVPEVLALVTADADPSSDVAAPATSSGDGSQHPSDPTSMPQPPSCSNRLSNVNYIPPSAILTVLKAPA